MKRLAVLAGVLLVTGSPPGTALARTTGEGGTLSFTLENDLAFGNDRYYTHGLRVTWVPGRDVATPGWAASAAGLLPWVPGHGRIRHEYAVGQSIFTPRVITIPDPPLDDRPYAGWLYGAIGLGVESGRRLDMLALSVGVVGPASLAEQTQKLVHELLAGDEALGWDTQLANEPGVMLACQRRWRGLARPALAGAQWDVTPHAGATLGNVFTYGNVGLTARFGRRLPDDYGPPRIQPGLPGTGDFSPAPDFGWYAYAGIEARAVARNIFLDGNTFRDSRSVDKKPLVGDLQFGVVLDWPTVRVHYTHVFRSREFRSQEGNAHFGALGVSVKL